MEPQQIIEHFHSAPLLDGVDPRIQHVLKFLPPSPNTPKLAISTRGMYVDMTELPETVNFSQALADCDILKEILNRSGPQIQHALKLFKQSAKETHEESALEAVRICTEMGLTENNFSAKGGGFFWIIVIVLLASGCATCTQGGKYPPVKHP